MELISRRRDFVPVQSVLYIVLVNFRDFSGRGTIRWLGSRTTGPRTWNERVAHVKPPSSSRNFPRTLREAFLSAEPTQVGTPRTQCSIAELTRSGSMAGLLVDSRASAVCPSRQLDKKDPPVIRLPSLISTTSAQLFRIHHLDALTNCPIGASVCTC